MFVVGLTGGIGSGKSAAASRFRELGIKTVDADQASRAVVQPGSPALTEISSHFGAHVLLEDGSLDRAAMRSIIFEDEGERRWLEQLLHPLIGDWISAQLRTAESPYCILESPLLLETNQHQRCDRIIVVDAPEAVQLERYMARDNGSEAEGQAIIKSQMTRQDRLARADYVIDNSGSLENLYSQVDKLHITLLETASAG